MKIKKIISKGLIVGLLFNNIGHSFANTKNLDGRYETFEGSSITVNNILEEDKIDVEIEGNTLVNIINYNNISSVDNHWDYNVSERTGYMKLTNKTDTYKGVKYKCKEPLKLNTEYTLSVNITKNTMQNDINNNIAKIAISKSWGENNSLFITTNKTGHIKYVFRPDGDEKSYPWIEVLPNAYDGEFEFKDLMIIEGNYIDKDIEFFEGLKSSFQGDTNSNHLVISHGKNLMPYNNTTISASSGVTWFDAKGKKDIYGPNVKDKTDTWIHLDEGYYIINGDFFKCGYQIINSNEKIFYFTGNNLIPKGDYCLRLKNDNTIDNFGFKNVYIYKKETPDTKKEDFISYNSSMLNFNLKEPLRALPNGVKDRIIKRNGQWVIERNCWGGVITDKDELAEGNSEWNNNVYGVTVKYPPKTISSSINCISDRLPSKTPDYLSKNDTLGIFAWEYSGNKVFIDVGKSSIQDTIEYLKNNPIQYIYELNESVYEPINVNLDFYAYLDTTYIASNSNIPCNIKVTVDRVINKAVEAIKLAKENPTIDNISIGRMWANLMKENSNKDILSNQLDSITEIVDLTIDKKTVTSNMDVYIKSQNGLTVTLSTNSIIFDEFSGAEDMEKLNAVNLTINSSLPYQLNSYLLQNIQNSDGSKIIDLNKFNIKNSSDNDYKEFLSIGSKLALKDDCTSGNGVKHNIDLKLKGGDAHEADIYKTVIKFEAEQK